MPRKAPKRWTVLIYMVADDPQGGELLDQQAVREMDQITHAALDVGAEHLHVAVQVDFRTLPGVWRRSIGESTFIRPEGNAADPATLYGFFDWAVAECPAEHYLLVFWGHSRGQFGMFADSDPFDYTAQTLTLDELRDALTAAKRSIGKPVDVIAFKDCFMATLETAYELTGLAKYLLASSGLVPVVGWPYEEMFKCLTNDKHLALTKDQDRALDAAKGMLTALRAHYVKKENKGSHDEVPYSLLSTRGAGAVVKQLEHLFGNDHAPGVVDSGETQFSATLDAAASEAGDPALVDLGVLVFGKRDQPEGQDQKNTPAQSLAGPNPGAERAAALTEHLNTLAHPLGNARPGLPDNDASAAPDRLVIDHTGQKFGGVSVFVYPSLPRKQRESQLTRLANEKVYRALAICADTNWADIALQSMPIKSVGSEQPDVSAAVAMLERLQRVAVGMAPGTAAAVTRYRRRLAARNRDRNLTDADVAQAAEYAAIADLAARLASFAADKGGDSFAAKGGDSFAAKGGDSFAAR